MVVPIAITTMSDSMPEKTRITVLIAAGAVNLLLIPSLPSCCRLFESMESIS